MQSRCETGRHGALSWLALLASEADVLACGGGYHPDVIRVGVVLHLRCWQAQQGSRRPHARLRVTPSPGSQSPAPVASGRARQTHRVGPARRSSAFSVRRKAEEWPRALGRRQRREALRATPCCARALRHAPERASALPSVGGTGLREGVWPQPPPVRPGHTVSPASDATTVVSRRA